MPWSLFFSSVNSVYRLKRLPIVSSPKEGIKRLFSFCFGSLPDVTGASRCLGACVPKKRGLSTYVRTCVHTYNVVNIASSVLTQGGRILSKFFFNKKLKNVSCEYDRVNGWNSTLQAAWYIRHVRIIWFLWTKRTIWWLMLSFTQDIVRACSMFYPYEGCRSVTPLDAARVSRTIFHNHSVHWYYITLVKGRYYIKHDINVRHGKQNPRRGRWLKNVSCEYDRLNGWNSTLQAAWYIRHVRIIWFLWTIINLRYDC